MRQKLFTILVIALFQLLSVSINGQSRFGAEDTTRYITKTTDFSVLHDRIILENYTNDSLQMRWNYTGTSIPGPWVVIFEDPSNTYDTIYGGESMDFTLPDSLNKVNNKFIIGIHHNNDVGYGLLAFTVYEISNPSDSMTVYFEVTVSQGTAGMSLNIEKFNFLPYPNPVKNRLNIETAIPEAHIILKTFDGRIYPLQLSPNNDLDLSGFSSGVYMLEIVSGGKRFSHKIIKE